MLFPKLPYKFRKANQAAIEFAGINKTENYKDGNLRDSIGLSTAEYPTLTQSRPFALEGRIDIVDMHEHNGMLLTVSKDGSLHFDGKYLGKVKPSRKQYAAVNTRLCIFPDKMYIDLNDFTLHDLAEVLAEGTVAAGSKYALFFEENVSDKVVSGDKVDISGSPATLYDKADVVVEKVEENTITFPQNTFSGALSYVELTEDLSGETIINVEYYASGDGDVEILTKELFKVDIYDTVKAGRVLFYDGFGIGVWDKDRLNEVGRYDAERVYAGVADIEMSVYTFDGAVVKVNKHIPDLDYICESENRLWGVSNRTHTIYASALGLPGVFTEFEVISTDSYAVAVASEDDFTAICAYGGGVCCFKENRLHKILGSFPAQYYMNEYEIAGVQKGSERSLQIIDEVLYYKGRYGVYAYSGGVPKLVSYELGNVETVAKASVADGLNYYISLGDGVYVYDKLHGLWMKHTSSEYAAMVTDGQLIYGLSNGVMFVNSGKVADSKWSAEFTPFDMRGFFKKGYSKLTISAEMGKGSALSVHVREDNQPWRKVYNQAATNNMLLSVPLRVGRCDRFSVKIEGKGIVKLRGIARDIIVGSER